MNNEPDPEEFEQAMQSALWGEPETKQLEINFNNVFTAFITFLLGWYIARKMEPVFEEVDNA